MRACIILKIKITYDYVVYKNKKHIHIIHLRERDIEINFIINKYLVDGSKIETKI